MIQDLSYNWFGTQPGTASPDGVVFFFSVGTSSAPPAAVPYNSQVRVGTIRGATVGNDIHAGGMF